MPFSSTSASLPMENTEPSVSSTATRTWHDFLECMRQPSATEFVKTIKTFIVSFSKNDPNPEKDSESVQDFFATMDSSFRAHPLWAGRTEDELESTSEGLEKYIMTKLFPRVFASHPDDVKLDNKLYNKSLLIQQFIEPEHLDIQQKYRNENSWLLAQKELQKINSYKAPRDKLACILSCCKVISTSLFNASESPPGADDFLPVLIYVTIKANVAQLHSNLVYIQRFRNRLRLGGETEYLFTNMLSAESFILNIDAKALSMDETEFENNMESAKTIVSSLSGDNNGENMEIRRGQSENVSESKLKEVPSVSDLENKGATMIVPEEKASENFWNFPFLYSKAPDLKVGDVEELLNGYKQLVFKYVCLAKGLGVPILPPPETGISGGNRETDGGGEGAGVSAPPPEIQAGDGNDVGGVEGDWKGLDVSAAPAESSKGEGKVVDGGQVDNGRAGGGGNDGVEASTPETVVTGEVVSQLEVNVEK